MTEFPSIHTGDRALCLHPVGAGLEFPDADSIAIVHACKTCHSKLCGQPARDHPDYLYAEDGGELYLNLIDPDLPLFRLELFTHALDWMEKAYRQGSEVVIHCDQGNSRSRTLALLLAARVGLITRKSYLLASIEFSRQTGRLFTPGKGIRTFVSAEWEALTAEKVIAVRAKPEPKVIEVEIVQEKPVNLWASTGAKEKQEERAANDGWSAIEVDEIADDPEMWARTYGRIEERVTKDPIRYVLSPLQIRLFAWYRHCQAHQIPCRVIMPKIRRGGGSTGAEAILYCHAHNYKSRLGSVGTDNTVAMNMFGMMRFFDQHDKFTGWGRATKILETGYLEWSNGSTWETYTAENPEAARSAGLQGYHASEVGRWQNGGAKDAKETLKSMLGAVPRRGFTVVIEESTAQGAQGAFFDRFQSGRWPTAAELGCLEGEEYWRKWEDETPQNIARNPSERAFQFVRCFAAWFEDDENRPESGVTADEEEYIRATLDKKEIELIRRYRTIGPQGERLGHQAERATLIEQLAWRRAVIKTEFEGDTDGFEQENPSSPKEAFASSGRHTFNRAGCTWMTETAKQRTPMIGVLDRVEQGVIFRETTAADAWIQIWDTPKEGMRYISSLDTMGGRSHTKNLKDADYNAGVTLRAAYVDQADGRKRAHQVVAALMPKNQDDPDILTQKMGLMSDFYGGCLVVHEDNNTGAAFRQEAMRAGLNLYRRIETDKFTQEQTDYVGWMTTPETRPQLFATGKKLVRNNANPATREDGFQCWDEATCQEFADCIRDVDGQDRAPGSKHDDRLMATLIGLHCIEGATYYAGHKRKRTGPADRSLWRPARG